MSGGVLSCHLHFNDGIRTYDMSFDIGLIIHLISFWKPEVHVQMSHAPKSKYAMQRVWAEEKSEIKIEAGGI